MTNEILVFLAISYSCSPNPRMDPNYFVGIKSLFNYSFVGSMARFCSCTSPLLVNGFWPWVDGSGVFWVWVWVSMVHTAISDVVGDTPLVTGLSVVQGTVIPLPPLMLFSGTPASSMINLVLLLLTTSFLLCSFLCHPPSVGHQLTLAWLVYVVVPLSQVIWMGPKSQPCSFALLSYDLGELIK